MSAWAVVLAGVLLIPERACYVWIARAPEAFRRACATPVVARLGEPVAIVRKLFYGFKALQLAVFASWCYEYGGPALAVTDNARAISLGAALVVAGQILNLSAFYRLGLVGIFYGDRLGYTLPWCRAFPFSWLSHPQYVGAVFTIWGVFLAARFPHEDWPVLPALETVYYVASTWLENGGRRPQRAGPPVAACAGVAVGPGRPRSRVRGLRTLISPARHGETASRGKARRRRPPRARDARSGRAN
jgi:methylene-fatty-acyl-phospholipid synthase